MNFVAHWTEIAAALGLEIQSPVTLTLSDGRAITAPVLLKNFGNQRGIVLFEGIPSGITEIGAALTELGYASSCFGPYRENETVDLESAKEALADWTWWGPPDQRPEWLADPPEDDA